MNEFLRAFEHWLLVAAQELETSRDGWLRGKADRRCVPPTRRADAACTASVTCQHQYSQRSPSHGWKHRHRPDKALEGGDSRGLHPASSGL